MWMARRREGHGSKERCSPRSKESKSLSKVFGGTPKTNYADSQYSNRSSNCNTTRINTDSQSANKASKRREINGVVNRVKTSIDKERGETKRQSCFSCGAKPAHPRSQCPAKDVTCHKCGKKEHYKKCCKSKTGKQGTTGEPRQVQLHGLQATLTGASAYQTSVRDPAQDYHMMFGPHAPQDNQHTIFHHIQTFHVKSINDTSSKHIKPLWLSTANGGPMYEVECEIDTGAGCNVMPLYLHKSLFGDKSLTPTSVQIFEYGESPVANLGACTIALHTVDRQQPQMATCQVTNTRGYFILGRETAQQVGYIAFLEVTPPS